MHESALPKLTPMMEQWAQAKKEHPDAILLFRMGDFYELFGDDALIAAPILELALTSRDKDKSGLKMAGFPCHAAELYLAKLVDHGHKVALCDQLEDPKLKKGIVKRGITQIITPGTMIEAEKDGYEQAYLLSLVSDGDRYAIAALDVSTAGFLVTNTADKDKLLDEIIKLRPKEIVLLGKDHQAQAIIDVLLQRLGSEVSIRIEKRDACIGAVQTNLAELEARAALLIKSYVIELRGSLPAHIGLAQCYSIDAHMLMDRSTRINLDLFPKAKGDRSNLLSIMQVCKTAMGRRVLAKAIIAPSTELDLINERHDFVAELLEDSDMLRDLRELFASIYDLEKLTALAASNKIGPRYLGRLRDCLGAIAAIKTCLECSERPRAQRLAQGLPELSVLEEELKRALVPSPPISLKDGAIFCAGYERELDELIELSTNGHQLLLNLELRERELTGIASLKVKYTRVFGYYIEVTRSNIDKVPSRYQRKQTVANGERYMTEELSELEIRLNSAQESLSRTEARLFENLRQKTVAYASDLIAMAQTIGLLDMLTAFAELALRHSWVRPRMLPREERVLDITAGRHPIVESRCAEGGFYFVPNDLCLDSKSCSMALVTGPNMAGKSTVMRQAALIQVMAQIGSYVPAREATLSLCDSIFARVGASDDLSSGRSTFMVEMTETAYILHNASQNSLILLDEIGRGTSTFDGMSIAQAVAEYIHDHLGSRTLFATHYHELTELEKSLPRLRNFHVEVEEKSDSIHFLYSLKAGPAAESFGIQVAKLAGLPPLVVARAREVLLSLEERPEEESRAAVKAKAQPDLFTIVEQAVEHPIATQLAKIDLNRITPLQALNKLQALQNSIRTNLGSKLS